MSKCFEVKLLVELQGGDVGNEAVIVNDYVVKIVKNDYLKVLDSSIRTVEGKELENWVKLLK